MRDGRAAQQLPEMQPMLARTRPPPGTALQNNILDRIPNNIDREQEPQIDSGRSIRVGSKLPESFWGLRRQRTCHRTHQV